MYCSKQRERTGELAVVLEEKFWENFLLHFDENRGRLLCCFQFRVVSKSKDTIRVFVNIKRTKILKTRIAVFYCSLELA